MSRIIKSAHSYKEPVNKTISIRKLESFLISSEEASEMFSPAPDMDHVLEAEKRAEEIISYANAEADKIRSHAESEKQRWEDELLPAWKEQAWQEGFLEGRQAGQDEIAGEMAEQLQTARDTVDKARLDYKAHIESSESAILSLSIKVAEKIIGIKLSESAEHFLPLVKRAVKEAREFKEVQLHIHPSRYGFLLAEKESLSSLFPRETDFYIYPNDDIDEQGCVIESSHGRIDAGVDSQLLEIKEKLLKLLEGE
ncbi:flagellar assembly protein FliH [Peribacillus sp. SCS-26]|uniref:flagellar assembly protein FliH n=1 Tax=Paraperibacillus marinus TaxID=3115295 RepID=UPI0039058085